MNRRTEQIIREKVRVHEQQVDIGVDTDALWGRLVASHPQPAKRVLKLNYRIAITAALLVAGATGVLMSLSNGDSSKMAVGNDIVTQSIPDNGMRDQEAVANKTDVGETSLESETRATPKRRKLATARYVDNVTEYLRNMDIPAMMGIDAGKEDMVNPDAERADTKWICY